MIDKKKVIAFNKFKKAFYGELKSKKKSSFFINKLKQDKAKLDAEIRRLTSTTPTGVVRSILSQPTCSPAQKKVLHSFLLSGNYSTQLVNTLNGTSNVTPNVSRSKISIGRNPLTSPTKTIGSRSKPRRSTWARDLPKVPGINMLDYKQGDSNSKFRLDNYMTTNIRKWGSRKPPESAVKGYIINWNKGEQKFAPKANFSPALVDLMVKQPKNYNQYISYIKTLYFKEFGISIKNHEIPYWANLKLTQEGSRFFQKKNNVPYKRNVK